jgi:hypothetical protein
MIRRGDMSSLSRGAAVRLLRVGVAVALLGLGSCVSMGPNTIPRDRFDYGAAIARSWKEQLLANLVRMRYVEAPTFVDVSSVINQYILEGEVSLGAGWNTSFNGDDTLNAGGAGRFSDRPTITYAPISGREFSVSLLTPVSPEAIFALVQAGWPPELIFRLTVRSVNGIDNAVAGPANRRRADPRFIEFLAAWGRLREARALGLRKSTTESGAKILVYRTGAALDAEVQRDLEFVHDTLGLDPDASEFTLSYGLVPANSADIAVLTMSMLELLNEMAWRAEVPPEHVEEGRTGPTYVTQEGLEPLMLVHYAKERPAESYAAVRNRDYWFYLDDRDVGSKRTFAIMQILFSLTESGDAARGPVVTIGS